MNVSQLSPRCNTPTYFRREAALGHMVSMTVAADDGLGVLGGLPVGTGLILENVSGLLLPQPSGSPLVLPPALVERLVERRVLEVGADDHWAWESWLRRRRKYCPHQFDDLHRADMARRRVRALDALQQPARPRLARVGGGRAW